MEILIFVIGGERYALPLADVRHVMLAVAVTRLPGAPRIVMGVVDVRGELVPVLDVRRRFGVPGRPVSPEDHFVLATAGARPVLLHVDRVDRLATVAAAAVEDPAGTVPGLEHVAGVARLEEGLVLIHDLGGFLSQAEAEDLDAALGASSAPRGASS